jgi:predicted PurR-regulated permease PerM
VFVELRSWPPRRWARVALVATVIILGGLILYRVRGGLAPFVLGLLAAYIVLPLVDWLQARLPLFLHRVHAARFTAIVLVYIGALALLAGFFAFIVPLIIAQIEQLIANRGIIVTAIQLRLTALRAWYMTTLPLAVRTTIENQVRTASGSLLSALQQGIVGGLTAVRNLVSLLLGYLIIPFWLFFVLYDARGLKRGVVGAIPEGLRPDLLSLAQLWDDVLGAYLRGQLVVAGSVGIMTMLALGIIGVNFFVLLGILVGILDLVPTLGPILALIPVLTIAAIEQPIKALWALIALLAIQQVEGSIIGPRVVGQSVQVRPALIMLLLVIGNELAGILGLVVIVPLAAILRDTIHYLYLRTAPEGIDPQEALQRVRRRRQG